MKKHHEKAVIWMTTAVVTSILSYEIIGRPWSIIISFIVGGLAWLILLMWYK